MNFADNIKPLQSLYQQKGLDDYFKEDNEYLSRAFLDINNLWLDNFNKIQIVKFLMIAEAPLWGKEKKYIYNPDINNSQFFYRSDLGDILKKSITDKKAFIKCCNDIGLLIVDISPFALNQKNTKINYRQLLKNEYRQLVSSTIQTYLVKKIALITQKKSNDIQVFFRYSRVKQTFQDIIAQVLIDNKIIKSINDIGDISQNGGGINKQKLEQIIKKNGR